MDLTNGLLMFCLIYLFILASYLFVFGSNIYILCLVIQISCILVGFYFIRCIYFLLDLFVYFSLVSFCFLSQYLFSLFSHSN